MSELLTSDHAQRSKQRRLDAVLIGSAVVTLLLYLVPQGRFIAYPLMLFSTLVHELGHGIAGLLVGGQFDNFKLYSDGSGLAFVRGVEPGWRSAVKSAGGLLGPALLAALCFVLVRGRQRARALVVLFAVGGLVAEILLIRNLFGLFFVACLVAGLGYVGLRRPARESQFLLAFLAAQLSVSVFSRSDYLFTREAKTGGGTYPSDVAQMAEQLGGTYWMWGSVCGGISLLVLGLGLWWAQRSFRH